VESEEYLDTIQYVRSRPNVIVLHVLQDLRRGGAASGIRRCPS
jgi:hypothetical protein